MKGYIIVASKLIVLCCLLSLLTPLVDAYYAGYTNTNYQAITNPTTDGAWTTPEEWNDAMVPPNLPASFHWREKWTWPSDIIQHFLVEFFIDNTNDTGDYFQFCMDRNADGGTAPQTDDIRIDWVGHSRSGLTVYRGNGTGWEVFTGWTWGTDIYAVDSIRASPLNSTPHWVIEFWIDKSKPEFDISGSGYSPWIRLAVYDASNPAVGVQAWPPTSRDVPNNWGLETGTLENIPEPLSMVAVVLLSSFAVAVSCYCLRKRSQPKGTA